MRVRVSRLGKRRRLEVVSSRIGRVHADAADKPETMAGVPVAAGSSRTGYAATKADMHGSVRSKARLPGHMSTVSFTWSPTTVRGTGGRRTTTMDAACIGGLSHPSAVWLCSFQICNLRVIRASTPVPP